MRPNYGMLGGSLTDLIRHHEQEAERRRLAARYETWEKGAGHGEVQVETHFDAATLTQVRTVFRKPPPLPPEKTVGVIKSDWLMAAALRCKESEDFLRIEIEDKGITIIGEAGEEYMCLTISWAVLEAAEVNPLLLAIEDVEKRLEMVK